jgi:hypothetical protein
VLQRRRVLWLARADDTRWAMRRLVFLAPLEAHALRRRRILCLARVVNTH